jgi:hypothetical protein
MPLPAESLFDLQQSMRDAIVAGEAADELLNRTLQHPARFAIHLRHFEVSLVEALLTKFPATQWLVGTRYLTQAATQFIHEYPPAAPCIAEYGSEFPDFLLGCPGADGIPYLRDFAQLELYVGQASIAVSDSPFVRHLESTWPVDQLLDLYLTDTAPGQLTFEPEQVHLEITGARGDFHVRRCPYPSLGACQ